MDLGDLKKIELVLPKCLVEKNSSTLNVKQRQADEGTQMAVIKQTIRSDAIASENCKSLVIRAGYIQNRCTVDAEWGAGQVYNDKECIFGHAGDIGPLLSNLLDHKQKG